jgi:hypothetical protein
MSVFEESLQSASEYSGLPTNPFETLLNLQYTWPEMYRRMVDKQKLGATCQEANAY